MNQFLEKLENVLTPVMSKVANQKHLCAVRDALIATIPITVISSMALLFIYLPFPHAYVDFIANTPKVSSVLSIFNSFGMGVLSLFVAFGIGSRLAKSYNLDSMTGGYAALFTFLVTFTITTVDDTAYLAVKYLGAQGMFTAIITGFLAIEVMRLCDKYNIKITLPEQVPPNVASSFESLISTTISVGIMVIVVHVLGIDISELIASIITPIFSMSADSIVAPLLYALLTGVMWFFGIHPAVLSAIMTPIWIVNAEANTAAFTAGLAIPHLGVKPFIFTFLWIGGGGGTLALCVLMMFSKSQFLNKLGKLSFLPGLFNINEPILFGAPIVLNPTLAIPFTVAPILVTFVTYFAFSTGLVPGMAYPLAAVWTVPSLFAAFLVTTSWRAVALVIINFLIYLAAYYPFFKLYEKRMLEQEGEVVATEEVTA